MDAKKQIIFTHKSNGNEFYFGVPDGAQLADCYGASVAFVLEMSAKINAYAEQFKAKPVEEKVEEAKIEESGEVDGNHTC